MWGRVLPRLAIYIISFDKLVNTIVGTALGQMLLLVLREQGVETVNIAVHVQRQSLFLLVGSLLRALFLRSKHVPLTCEQIVSISKKSQRFS